MEGSPPRRLLTAGNAKAAGPDAGDPVGNPMPEAEADAVEGRDNEKRSGSGKKRRIRGLGARIYRDEAGEGAREGAREREELRSAVCLLESRGPLFKGHQPPQAGRGCGPHLRTNPRGWSGLLTLRSPPSKLQSRCLRFFFQQNFQLRIFTFQRLTVSTS